MRLALRACPNMGIRNDTRVHAREIGSSTARLSLSVRLTPPGRSRVTYIIGGNHIVISVLLPEIELESSGFI